MNRASESQWLEFWQENVSGVKTEEEAHVGVIFMVAFVSPTKWLVN